MKSFLLIMTVGLLVLSANHTSASTLYVDLNSPNPTPPYTNWFTAAINIQDAVDAAFAGDEIVVTNGTYATGGLALHGTMTNRVAVYKPLTVRSVNGALVTMILGRQVPINYNGDGAVRCVYMTNGAILSGFTLAKGATRSMGSGYAQADGGGVWCESGAAMVSECMLADNTAGYLGGGAYGGTLMNCSLVGNKAGGSGGGLGGGACGGTLTNCMLVGNSAGGGGGAVSNNLNSCTLADNSAGRGGGASFSTLNNCMVVGNSAQSSAGGVYSSTLTNCTLTSNSGGMYGGGGALSSTLNHCLLTDNLGGGAVSSTLNYCTLSGNSGFTGGGAASSILNDCQVISNSASQYGGGVSGGTLTNCTVAGNSAPRGGGAVGGTLNNCIVYFNISSDGSNFSQSGGITMNYCCTTPQPTNGVGNITSDPLFIDWPGGDLRLQSNSPCINAGNNAYALAPADLDGNPRIAGGTVDIGAYEVQNPGSVISFAWLQRYGLPTDGSADYADPDQDGMNNWKEWICGTNPTNTLSALRLLSVKPSAFSTAVTWECVADRTYFLERATNLADPRSFRLVAPYIPGHDGTAIFKDSGAVGSSPCFYRVGVR